MSDLVRYQGIDQHGQARHGHIFTTDRAGWVRKLYQAGWASLTVDRAGLKVGSITRHDSWACWWVLQDNGSLAGDWHLNLGGEPMD